MERPCWRPRVGGRKVTKTSVIEFLQSKRNDITLELRNIEINISSRARTV